MCVPLRDQSGKVRYYLGAQLDITGIVNDCTGLATLEIMVKRDKEHQAQAADREVPKETIQQDEFEQLSEAFNPQELEKLIMLRRRQQLQSDEGITLTESETRQRGDEESSRTAFTGLDNVFQLNGQGSAPPLGYYKSVRTSYRIPNIGDFADLISIFWFDRIHHFAFYLPRLICGYQGFSSHHYLIE